MLIQLLEQSSVQLCSLMAQELELGLERAPSGAEICEREQTQLRELLLERTFPLMGLELALALVLMPFAGEIGEMERWHLTALS